jgi:hypothetical protein
LSIITLHPKLQISRNLCISLQIGDLPWEVVWVLYLICTNCFQILWYCGCFNFHNHLSNKTIFIMFKFKMPKPPISLGKHNFFQVTRANFFLWLDDSYQKNCILFYQLFSSLKLIVYKEITCIEGLLTTQSLIVWAYYQKITRLLSSLTV